MPEDQVAVTAPAETPKDTIEVVSSTEEPVSSNVTEPVEKAAPQSDKPAETPEQQKNLRNQQRKAQKERLIRENAVKDEQLKTLQTELAKYTQPKKAEVKPKDLSKEPDINQYKGKNQADSLGDYLDFTSDLAEYRTNAVLSERDKKAAEAEKAKRIDSFNEQVNDVRTQMPDFDSKVSQLYEAGLIPQPIEDAILSSNISGKLAEHLIKFPGDLQQLNSYRPELLPQAIKKIEAFIKQGGQPQEKPRVTQATPPIKPPGNTARTDRSINSFTQEEIENMPISEYKKITNMK